MAESNSIRCHSCGIDFTVRKYRASTAKCCSVACANERRRGLEKRPVDDRFWEKVDISGADDCWAWLGATLTSGYGSFHLKGKSCTAHRLAYILTVGEIADGLHIRHKCDNPICCNPAHLETGTHADNMRDMAERGRASVSEETKKLISIARLGKKLSSEHREKLSAAAKARKPNNTKPVQIYGIEYPSVISAARALGRNKSWMFDQLKKGAAQYVINSE